MQETGRTGRPSVPGGRTSLQVYGRFARREAVLFLGKNADALRDFSQLRGRTVGVGAAGSGTEQIARQIFGLPDFAALGVQPLLDASDGGAGSRCSRRAETRSRRLRHPGRRARRSSTPSASRGSRSRASRTRRRRRAAAAVPAHGAHRRRHLRRRPRAAGDADKDVMRVETLPSSATAARGGRRRWTCSRSSPCGVPRLHPPQQGDGEHDSAPHRGGGEGVLRGGRAPGGGPLRPVAGRRHAAGELGLRRDGRQHPVQRDGRGEPVPAPLAHRRGARPHRGRRRPRLRARAITLGDIEKLAPASDAPLRGPGVLAEKLRHGSSRTTRSSTRSPRNRSRSRCSSRCGPGDVVPATRRASSRTPSRCSAGCSAGSHLRGSGWEREPPRLVSREARRVRARRRNREGPEAEEEAPGARRRRPAFRPGTDGAAEDRRGGAKSTAEEAEAPAGR